MPRPCFLSILIALIPMTYCIALDVQNSRSLDTDTDNVTISLNNHEDLVDQIDPSLHLPTHLKLVKRVPARTPSWMSYVDPGE